MKQRQKYFCHNVTRYMQITNATMNYCNVYLKPCLN